MTLHTKRTLSQETEHPLREKPILFSMEMVRAILAGRKTQTRRVVKLPCKRGVLGRDEWRPFDPENADDRESMVACSWVYGVPGDRLWVKETHAREMQLGTGATRVVYRASMRDGYLPGWDQKWKPSIFMPRKWSRISLPITSVRVERLQDISEEDAKAEGLEWAPDFDSPTNNSWGLNGVSGSWQFDPRASYRVLWESINGPGSWDFNPWVWVVGWDKAEVRR